MKRGVICIWTVLALMSSVRTEIEAIETREWQENDRRMAVVELSTIYMRQKPDYESALETQELMGTVVEIVGEEGYWREIVSPQPYRAWATEKGLVEMDEAELKTYMDAPKVIFTGLYGHIYKEPSYRAATLCDLVGGDILRLVAQQPERTSALTSVKESKASEEREGRKQTIRLRGKWTEVMLPSGRKGYVPTKELKPHEGFISIAQGEGSADSIDAETTEAIIAEAEKLLGVPYLWGGMSAKGVDCSGLVRISHIMNGILLPRNASQQIKCGDKVEIPRQARNDREAALEACNCLKRGDLIFFGTPATDGKPMKVTHVGIYLGNGKIIHSSHLVRINSLLPGDNDYYENSWKLLGATRL